MKHIAGLFVATALLCAGQSMQERGRKIVDEAIAALGGEKFLIVKDRVESGRAYSFYNEELSGLSVAKFYTRYVAMDPAEAATKLAMEERQGFGKDEYYYVAFRGDQAWEVTYRGAKPLETQQINRHRDTALNNIFYILRTRLKEPGLVFEARGSDNIDNMPVNIVDVVDSRNRVVTVYFHQTTKLPVRQDWVWRDPQTRERNEDVTRFGRYRETGGTQWPYQVNRFRNKEKIYEMFADTVVVNQNLPDALFAEPTKDTKAR